ncbi:hypothetical protein IWX90DRAFT_35708 [Phyllosticta citrichinensis]|uniref:Uncharacterized protein n=1 Tax=Phyllosticta citrichinensis TaxID=1130410 RepID=A0ABR1Y7M2_9PEZI
MELTFGWLVDSLLSGGFFLLFPFLCQRRFSISLILTFLPIVSTFIAGSKKGRGEYSHVLVLSGSAVGSKRNGCFLKSSAAMIDFSLDLARR